MHTLILFKTRQGEHTPTVANLFLFLMSIFFYAWGEPVHCILLFFSTGFNFTMAKCISTEKKRAALFYLVGGISVNILFLLYFKYATFIMSNGGLAALNAALPTAWVLPTFSGPTLPLGISFYTFQAISYLIDVYRKEVPSATSFLDFGCYLTMFPQLVAGPIVRYKNVYNELRTRRLELNTFSEGAQRFIIGLAKKLFIADSLGFVADAAFSLPPSALPALAAWAGIVCYSLQIYYDFSGYSDMAIGMGHMLGFTFPENFNYPYIARSIREFWQRWHMSLSTWFRDYLYIPLGGNRKGLMKTLLNLFLVFACCGIWHGAEWTFLVWGFYYGAFLILERLFPRFPSCLPRPVQHLYAILVILCGWVVFRSPDLPYAADYLLAMSGKYALSIQANAVWMQLFTGDVLIALVLGIFFAAPVHRPLQTFLARQQGTLAGSLETAKLFGLLVLLAMTFLPLFGATYNPFIYFRF